MLFARRLPLISNIPLMLLFLVIQSVSAQPLNSNEFANSNGNHPLIVDTLYGPVKGFYLPEGMQAYLGIPYAKQPVKELRWEPPVEPTPWGPDVWKAFQVSPGCPQVCFGNSPEAFCPRQMDEGCLYLNIWAPHGTNSSSNLPVVLFIHGGSFVEWSASAPGFDGRFVAGMSDVIFVSFNYRLGAFGWLKTEGKEGLTGNYGLMDQRAAMKFVQENIRNFGGNPEKVTLNGQSAGSQSITLHMTNPVTEGFFHQAILQSNPITLPLADIDEAVKLSRRFAAYLNCTPTDTLCLRNHSVDDVLRAQQQSREIPINIRNPLLWFEQFGPVIDGVDIKRHPIIDIAEGNFQHKPLITGDTSSESAAQVYSLFPNAPPQIPILSSLAAYLGRYTLSVLEEYWDYWSLDIRRLLIEFFGDYIYICSTRNVTRSIETFTDIPIYSYYLNHTFNDTRFWDYNPDSICKTRGVTCHDTDLLFTLYSVTLSGYTYTPTERRLAHKVMAYWANFFHTGDPNNSKWRKSPNGVKNQSVYDKSYDQDYQIFWHPYASENNWPSLYLQTPKNKYIYDFKHDECNVLDQVGYNGPVGPLQPHLTQTVCDSLREKEQN